MARCISRLNESALFFHTAKSPKLDLIEGHTFSTNAVGTGGGVKKGSKSAVRSLRMYCPNAVLSLVVTS